VVKGEGWRVEGTKNGKRKTKDERPETKDERPETKDLFELLIRGFARLERGVHPVDEGAVGSIRFLRWPERGRRGQEFSEEFFALDQDPDAVLAAVRRAEPGPDHLIAEVSVQSEPAREAYLAAGYEIGSQEPLMAAHLTDANTVPDPDGAVRRVTSMDDVEQILAAQRSVGYPERLFSQALLDDPQVSIRAIFADGAFAAIGKLAVVTSGAYITDVMTMPGHRRQGLGAAVMRQLHADARTMGAIRSVLTSTAMARSLYERLGYRQIGLVTLYATPERIAG
jgi:predicted GNAT family acetyltransferase